MIIPAPASFNMNEGPVVFALIASCLFQLRIIGQHRRIEWPVEGCGLSNQVRHESIDIDRATGMKSDKIKPSLIFEE